MRLEVQSLKGQQEAMESKVLGMLEGIDPAREQVATTEGEITTIEEEKGRLAAAIKAQWKTIDSELARKEERKRGALEPIESDLLELYEKLREIKEGVAVASYDHGVCGGCHMTLSPAEQDEAFASDLPRCVHCRRISRGLRCCCGMSAHGLAFSMDIQGPESRCAVPRGRSGASRCDRPLLGHRRVRREFGDRGVVGSLTDRSNRLHDRRASRDPSWKTKAGMDGPGSRMAASYPLGRYVAEPGCLPVAVLRVGNAVSGAAVLAYGLGASRQRSVAMDPRSRGSGLFVVVDQGRSAHGPGQETRTRDNGEVGGR